MTSIAEKMEQNYHALLVDYAVGALSGPQGLAVAAHLAMRERARPLVREMENIGGALLMDCPPEHMQEGALARILDQLNDEDAPISDDCTPHVMKKGNNTYTPLDWMPDILTACLPDGCTPRWKTLYPGIKGCKITALSVDGCTSRFLKIAPGMAGPKHSHGGVEITLMLDGAASDEGGTYRRGDLIVTDEDITHRPVADPKEGCICLVINTAPPKLSGLYGSIFGRFLTA